MRTRLITVKGGLIFYDFIFTKQIETQLETPLAHDGLFKLVHHEYRQCRNNPIQATGGVFPKLGDL